MSSLPPSLPLTPCPPLDHLPTHRYGSAAKSRWYKAQAARNRGLLAQLPLADAGDSDATDRQPLMGAAAAAAADHSSRERRQTGSITDDAQAWTTAAPPHPMGSITGALTQRRQGAQQQNGDLNGTAGRPGPYLWSLSAPGEGRTAAQLAGGGVVPPDAGAAADVAAGARMRSQLVSRSWGPGSPGGAVTFNSKPLARWVG